MEGYYEYRTPMVNYWRSTLGALLLVLAVTMVSGGIAP